MIIFSGDEIRRRRGGAIIIICLFFSLLKFYLLLSLSLLFEMEESEERRKNDNGCFLTRTRTERVFDFLLKTFLKQLVVVPKGHLIY